MQLLKSTRVNSIKLNSLRAVCSIAVAVVISACATPQRAPAPAPIPTPQPVPQPVAAPAAKPAVNEGTLRVLSQVEELKQEIMRLRSEVERQQNEISQLATRSRELYDDADVRLRSQESSIDALRSQPQTAVVMPAPAPMPAPVVAAPAAVTPSPTGAVAATPSVMPTTAQPAFQPQIGAATQPVPSAPAPADNTVVIGSTAGTLPAPTARPITQPSLSAAPATGAAPAPAVAAPAPQQLVPATPQATDAYDAAFELIKQSRFNEANEAFNRFITQYGNTDLVDDAAYWMAESHYFGRQFEGALAGYQNLMTTYPTSEKVPNAMLKIGYVQYEIGANADARATLGQVTTRYPGSSVAQSAQQRLAKMDREGR